jgi:hypothetical protein
MQEYETITMPEEGLGSFLTSNLDEIDDNILMFGHGGGINSIKEVADRMASMGRNGDNYIVHATEQEVIIPRDVVENNPKLINQVKDAIAADGTDPDRYVVGSSSNSINPLTGQPEFFKFLKNIVKKVKKVFKKAAKIILPVAINALAPGLGTIYSAAIGAGIGGLIQGESLGDALKSAALGGITAGVASGVSGALQSLSTDQTLGQGFMAGLKGGLPASYSGSGLKGALPNLKDFSLREAGDPLFMGTGFAGTKGYADLVKKQIGATQALAKPFDLLAEYEKNIAKGIPSTEAMDLAKNSQNIANAAAAAGSGFSVGKAALLGGLGLATADAAGLLDPIPAKEVEIEGFDPSDTSETRVAENPEKYSTGTPSGPFNYITPTQAIYSGQPITNASYSPSLGTYNPIVPSLTYANLIPTGAGTNNMMGTMVPSSGGVSTYVPPAPIELPNFQQPIYGYDEQGNPIYTPTYNAPITPSVQQETAFAANGGAMNFPRRTGQIEGPGTETSDDIPAMLSDGEFVMTAKAVKGAGNGSREQGFRKMYDIMRSFEGGAVA